MTVPNICHPSTGSTAVEVQTLKEHLIKSSTETLQPTLNSIFHSDAIGHYLDVNSVTGEQNINTETMEFIPFNPLQLYPYAQVSKLPLRTSRESEQDLTQRVRGGRGRAPSSTWFSYS